MNRTSDGKAFSSDNFFDLVLNLNFKSGKMRAAASGERNSDFIIFTAASVTRKKITKYL